MAAGEEGGDLKVTRPGELKRSRQELLALRGCLDDSAFKREKRSGGKVLGWACAVEAPVGHSEGGEAAGEGSRGAQAADVAPRRDRAAALLEGRGCVHMCSALA